MHINTGITIHYYVSCFTAKLLTIRYICFVGFRSRFSRRHSERTLFPVQCQFGSRCSWASAADAGMTNRHHRNHHRHRHLHHRLTPNSALELLHLAEHWRALAPSCDFAHSQPLILTHKYAAYANAVAEVSVCKVEINNVPITVHIHSWHFVIHEAMTQMDYLN